MKCHYYWLNHSAVPGDVGPHRFPQVSHAVIGSANLRFTFGHSLVPCFSTGQDTVLLFFCKQSFIIFCMLSFLAYYILYAVSHA